MGDNERKVLRLVWCVISCHTLFALNGEHFGFLSQCHVKKMPFISSLGEYSDKLHWFLTFDQ